MKRILTVTLALAAAMTMLIAFSGCGGAKVPERLVGQWECADLASDGYTDTSFYALTIENGGVFSLYDEDAGNPGISGISIVAFPSVPNSLFRSAASIAVYRTAP